MTQTLTLLVVAVLSAAEVVLTYGRWRTSWLYVPLTTAFAVILSALWWQTARHIDDVGDLWRFALVWDVLLIGIFFILPVLVYEIALRPWQIAGLVLALAGIALVKAG